METTTACLVYGLLCFRNEGMEATAVFQVQGLLVLQGD